MRSVEHRVLERSLVLSRPAGSVLPIFGIVGIGLLASAAPRPSAAEGLTAFEEKIVDVVDAQAGEAEKFLERAVEINSGTLNLAGVREVGRLYESALSEIGFDTRWIEMPAEMGRAGHLFAEIDGDRGARLLLIGHLDTVFEVDSPFQTYSRQGELVFGPGAEDMKGGNTVILFALKALRDAGVLDGRRVIVALTGDEEMPGAPLEVARRDLRAAGERSDYALGFEAGVRGIHTATVARRGASSWTLRVTANPAHSSQIFDDSIGAGAIFEASRILDRFYSQIRGERHLTFNPGVILGGTEVEYDSEEHRGSAFGKSNIIAESAVVDGDLRFITREQEERTRERMRAIVARSAAGTESEITFSDGYPAMSPTPGNDALLERLEQVSQDLGFGPIEALDPSERGAADISFVAAQVKGSLDGLGPVGWYGHTVDERIDISTLPIATKKAAVLIYRLTEPTN